MFTKTVLVFKFRLQAGYIRFASGPSNSEQRYSRNHQKKWTRAKIRTTHQKRANHEKTRHEPIDTFAGQ